MNLAHLHLLLNHFPTVGFGIGLGLFVVSFSGRNEDLKRAALVIFFLVALLSIPTYLTGSAAQNLIKDVPGISPAVIAVHESAALVAFAFMQLTGLSAWLGLWQYRRIKRVPGWNVVAVTSLAALTFGLMANAANVGGEIRHPEILSKLSGNSRPVQCTQQEQALPFAILCR